MKAAVEVMTQTVAVNHKIFLMRKYAHFYSCSNSLFTLIRDNKLHFFHRYFPLASYCYTLFKLTIFLYFLSTRLLH